MYSFAESSLSKFSERKQRKQRNPPIVPLSLEERLNRPRGLKAKPNMRILIIEDDSSTISNMHAAVSRLVFADAVELTVASNQGEVLSALKGANEKFDGIILDACLNEDGVMDTYFVFPRLKRMKYAGIVLANSGEMSFNTELLRCGATHRRRGMKHLATLDIISIFVERFFDDPEIRDAVALEMAKFVVFATSGIAITGELKKLSPPDRKKHGHALLKKMDGEIPGVLKNSPQAMGYIANLASNLIQLQPL